MAKPWTNAHRREALRRTYEIAAELSGAGREDEARLLIIGTPPRPAASAVDPRVLSESGWRLVLAEGGLDGAQITREVRRVRARAEGRLVEERETFWRALTVAPDNRYVGADDLGLIADPEQAERFTTKAAAKDWETAFHDGIRVVRVTITRLRISKGGADALG